MSDAQDEPALPQDLIDLERAWYEAEAACIAAPHDGTLDDALVGLGVKLYLHEHWAKVANRYETAVELSKAAQAA